MKNQGKTAFLVFFSVYEAAALTGLSYAANISGIGLTSILFLMFSSVTSDLTPGKVIGKIGRPVVTGSAEYSAPTFHRRVAMLNNSSSSVSPGKPAKPYPAFPLCWVFRLAWPSTPCAKQR